MTSIHFRFVSALIILLSFVASSWNVHESVSNASPMPSPTPVGSVDSLQLAVGQSPTKKENRPLYVPGQLIVGFKPTTSKAAIAEAVSRVDGSVTRQLLLPGYVLVSIPTARDVSAATASLHRDPNIELVEPNAYRYADFISNDPAYAYQWHFPQIQMPQAWDISIGNNITVAVVDTGIAYEDYDVYRRAPDLANTTFVAGWDFVNNDGHPNDDEGHGTHVAGTIAQSTNNAIGVAGIAYGAKIMPVKVLDGNGSGTIVDIAQGIIWAADNGAKVINLSLGSLITSSFERDAVDYAYNKGVVVVAASGNDGIGSVAYPAAYPNVIAVGATRYDQARTYYSNYGSALDLVAPGGDCQVDQNGDGYVDGVLQQTFASGDPASFGYYFECGTSMAAPHVSGVAALLLARNQSMTPDLVRRVMQATAKDLGANAWDQFYGCGLVQAYDALRHPSVSSASLPSTTMRGPSSSASQGTPELASYSLFLPVVFRAASDACGPI